MSSQRSCDAACQATDDQLQRGHLSNDVAIQSSPVLFDAGCQTEISILKSWPDLFYTVSATGHATPALFDGDFAA
eukprot:2845036-Karenia_brevis.AAC.1